MKITNFNNFYPNVLHFHGQNKTQLPQTFSMVCNEHEVNANYDKSKLAIISTWTDDGQCCLLQQCKKYNIPLINCVPDNYDRTQQWYMPNKIKFFLNTLEKIDQEYVMFLDGYDVLLTHLDDILDKYLRIGYDIIYGPSCNNYPDIFIDCVPNRINKGIYRFFNAGCCIGKKEALKKFYQESLEYINIENPMNSEQFIMRHAFKKYSNDMSQRFITVDWQCEIFQSMGVLDCTFNDSHTEITMIPNRNVRKNIIITGSDGFIGKQLVQELRKDETNKIYLVDRKQGLEVKNIDFLINYFNIDIIYHLAAQTSVFNEDLDAIVDDNIVSFIKLAKICNDKGIKLVYASSSTANNENTTSLYGLSKRFDEEFAKIYCPSATGIRLHNVYGKNPREGTLLWCLLNQDETILYNNGENKRYFTYIDDAVKGLIKASYDNGGLYNCVNYEEITTKEFADIVGRKYSLTKKKRDKDNINQHINFNIPNILEKYINVKDGIEKCH